jgi:predicted house-cleaning NTP pyrophosphatase (Maf/HAM1 superfamily)
MLLRLRGRSHLVMTALAALSPADGMLNTAVSVSEVTMREYSLAEIHAYVESGDPLDKAGAYAIQHPGFHPVERVSGCYAGVMGLPMCLLPKILLPFQLAIPEGQTQLNTFCGLDGQPQTHGCLVARWLKE